LPILCSGSFFLTHFPASSDNPAGNFSSVGNQNLVKGWLLQICEQKIKNIQFYPFFFGVVEQEPKLRIAAPAPFFLT
jgi:hypothetical protein